MSMNYTELIATSSETNGRNQWSCYGFANYSVNNLYNVLKGQGDDRVKTEKKIREWRRSERRERKEWKCRRIK